MNSPRRHRHVDAQAAGEEVGAAAEHGAQRVEVGHQFAAARVIGFALLRHLHAARGPLQQARAERLFELAHGAGHGRVRQAELACGAAEAVQLRHFQEDLDGLEFVHGFFVIPAKSFRILAVYSRNR
jgi:hypothetical protein